MKTGPLIVAVGGGFSLALLVFAMFADDMWEDDDYDDAPPIVAGIPSPHRDGRENMACSTCHRIMGRKLVGADGIAPAPRNPNKDTPPIVAGTPSPHRDGRENMACSTCHRIMGRKLVGADGIAPAPRNPNKDTPPIVAGTPSPHRDGRENIACSTCHKIVAREGVGAQGNAQTATSRNVATPGLVPSIGTDTWRYQGNVKKNHDTGRQPRRVSGSHLGGQRCRYTAADLPGPGLVSTTTRVPHCPEHLCQGRRFRPRQSSPGRRIARQDRFH